MEVRVYVVGAGFDSVVPWNLKGSEMVFFGPCKKSLRQEFKSRFLCDGVECVDIRENNIYLLGIFPAAKGKKRKILWAGKAEKAMTFRHAFESLKGPEYRDMEGRENSPMHVQPVYRSGKFEGYQHCSHLHDDEWIKDLLAPPYSSAKYSDGGKTLLRPVTGEGFQRDCCLLCSRILFDQTNGVEVSDRIVETLKKEQPEQEVDAYYLFGRDSRGYATGLRGRDLHMKQFAENMVKAINRLAYLKGTANEDRPQSKRVRC